MENAEITTLKENIRGKTGFGRRQIYTLQKDVKCKT